jgi:hypothetical protein
MLRTVKPINNDFVSATNTHRRPKYRIFLCYHSLYNEVVLIKQKEMHPITRTILSVASVASVAASTARNIFDTRLLREYSSPNFCNAIAANDRAYVTDA